MRSWWLPAACLALEVLAVAGMLVVGAVLLSRVLAPLLVGTLLGAALSVILGRAVNALVVGTWATVLAGYYRSGR
jgi:hypothetical protein